MKVDYKYDVVKAAVDTMYGDLEAFKVHALDIVKFAKEYEIVVLRVWIIINIGMRNTNVFFRKFAKNIFWTFSILPQNNVSSFSVLFLLPK